MGDYLFAPVSKKAEVKCTDVSCDLPDSVRRNPWSLLRAELTSLLTERESCDDYEFCVGQEIEVKCTDGNWYKATLMEYGDENDCEIRFLPESVPEYNVSIHPDLLVRSVLPSSKPHTSRTSTYESATPI